MNVNVQKQQAITNGALLQLRRKPNAHRRRRRNYWTRVYNKLVVKTSPPEYREFMREVTKRKIS